MQLPIVTETRVALEPCTPDTFIADLGPHGPGGAHAAPATAGKGQDGRR